MPTSEDEIRDEVHRRFRVWGWQGAPARRYALLVAGYLRTRGPFHVDGEEKYLSLDRYLVLPDGTGLRLVELVEASADRPLTPTERAETGGGVLATVEEGLRRRVGRESICHPYDYLANVNCLRLALDDPQRAAALLILLPEVVPADEPWLLPPPQYPAVRQVMECLCPARWNSETADWKPSQDAVSWAQRMYEGRAFDDLPILADMLEDGGCPNRSLLDHCRSGGDHFRGCVAVDRILGRRS